MRTCTDFSRLALAAGQTMELRDAMGSRVECLSGSLWITQHEDSRDITLKPGQVFTLDRNGKALLHAFEPSLAWVTETRPLAPGAAWWTRAGAALSCYFMRVGMQRVSRYRAYRF